MKALSPLIAFLQIQNTDNPKSDLIS